MWIYVRPRRRTYGTCLIFSYFRVFAASHFRILHYAGSVVKRPRTYDEEAGLEKAWIKRFVRFTRQPQNLTHVIHPEMASGVVHVADVAEQLLRLDLQQPTF